MREFKHSTVPGSSLVTLSSKYRTGDLRALEIRQKLTELGIHVPDTLDANISVREGIFTNYIHLFITENPDAHILNLGCGFCTRFYELDNGKIIWTELDLPDVMDLRNQVLADDNPRHKSTTIDLTNGLDIPCDLIVAEGVFMFIEKPTVLGIVDGKRAIFDIRGPKQLNHKMFWGDVPPYRDFNVVKDWRFGQNSEQGQWVLLVE